MQLTNEELMAMRQQAESRFAFTARDAQRLIDTIDEERLKAEAAHADSKFCAGLYQTWRTRAEGTVARVYETESRLAKAMELLHAFSQGRSSMELQEQASALFEDWVAPVMATQLESGAKADPALRSV